MNVKLSEKGNVELLVALLLALIIAIGFIIVMDGVGHNPFAVITAHAMGDDWTLPIHNYACQNPISDVMPQDSTYAPEGWHCHLHPTGNNGTNVKKERDTESPTTSTSTNVVENVPADNPVVVDNPPADNGNDTNPPADDNNTGNPGNDKKVGNAGEKCDNGMCENGDGTGEHGKSKNDTVVFFPLIALIKRLWTTVKFHARGIGCMIIFVAAMLVPIVTITAIVLLSILAIVGSVL